MMFFLFNSFSLFSCFIYKYLYVTSNLYNYNYKLLIINSSYNFINIMTESHIDPRKLNLDYIISTISDKIRKSMVVPNGTIIKCLRDVNNDYRKQVLTKDVSYSVRGSYIQGGYLKVNVTNDLGGSDYYDYANFEDMAIHREDLLRSLLG